MSDPAKQQPPTRLTWIELDPWDSLFFREAAPWSAPGGAGFDSRFPPPPRAVAGAVRRAFQARGSADEARIASESLRLHGPYLERDGELLLPLPASLVEARDLQARRTMRSLAWRFPRFPEPEVFVSHLGPLRLPAGLEPDLLDPEPLEDHWITAAGAERLMAGILPERAQVLPQEAIVCQDPRVGLELDAARGVAADGQLFATRHLRLQSGVRVVAGVHYQGSAGRRSLLADPGSHRLGGEGRRANLVLKPPPKLPPWRPDAPRDWGDVATGRQFALWFITSAVFPQRQRGASSGDWRHWYRVTQGEAAARRGRAAFRRWTCEPFGQPADSGATRPRFHIVSACSPAPQLEGGYGGGMSQDLLSMMAAGSVWFCELDDDQDREQALSTLHGAQLGGSRTLGRGQVLVLPRWSMTT